VGFLAGVLALGLWVATLLSRASLLPASHGALMIWGFCGSVILGFFLTAFPRQNQAGRPPIGLIYGAALGQITFLVLGLLGQPWFWWAGAATWALVWGYAMAVAVPSLARRWESTTASVPLALSAGLLALILGSSHPTLAGEIGVHGFLLLLALALLDRMLPFFSGKRIPGYSGSRLDGFLPLVAPLLLLRPIWLLDPVARWVAGVSLGGLVLRQMWGWRTDQGLREPLVGVLHLGALWIAAGFFLDAFGLDARHLWTIGGMGTLVIGFAVRVTRGHTGLPLKLGWAGVLAVLLVQGAALSRVFGAGHWHLLAGMLLVGACLLWLVSLGPRCFPRGP
jgi:uncharacterized protein involved in response to NO